MVADALPCHDDVCEFNGEPINDVRKTPKPPILLTLFTI
jgi:hypothetical protein